MVVKHSIKSNQPWSIRVILGALHPTYHNRGLEGDLLYTILEQNSPVVGGAPWYGFHPLPGSSLVESMGTCPPPWVPLLKKSYNGSSVLSTSLGSKTLNTSSLGLGEPQFKTQLLVPPGRDISHPCKVPSGVTHLHSPTPESAV